MGQLLVRNLPEEEVASLKGYAAKDGVSLEAQARAAIVDFNRRRRKIEALEALRVISEAGLARWLAAGNRLEDVPRSEDIIREGREESS